MSDPIDDGDDCTCNWFMGRHVRAHELIRIGKDQARAEIVAKLREKAHTLCWEARLADNDEEKRAFNLRASTYQEALEWIEAGYPS